MNETKEPSSRPPQHPPLPIFEEATSPVYRSNDGGLIVLPMQYGFGQPTFEIRHDGEPVLCTHARLLADAFVAGYDLAAGIAHDALGAAALTRALNRRRQNGDLIAEDDLAVAMREADTFETRSEADLREEFNDLEEGDFR